MSSCSHENEMYMHSHMNPLKVKGCIKKLINKVQHILKQIKIAASCSFNTYTIIKSGISNLKIRLKMIKIKTNLLSGTLLILIGEIFFQAPYRKAYEN